ncbi:MAG: tyrosine-type recombinase/integrase [Cytophagales bacterium]|nr:tyrosine-type recombinase/integrase [Cytophagales bacterium]
MTWKAKPVVHKGDKRIAVYFEKNKEWIARIRKLADARWSNQMKVWHLPDTEENRTRFKLEPDKARQLTAAAADHVQLFREWLMAKRYSHNTLKTYTEALKSFLIFFGDKPLVDLSNRDVIIFNNEYILKKKLSASYQNQIVNAIKLYFATVQNRQLVIEKIERPQRETRLPNVLSKEEVKLILEAPTNLKHKAMLAVIYSCGLRRSELLNLKPTDINSKRGIVLIRQAKGKKDRIVPLPQRLLLLLREYYQVYKPTSWLFEGQAKGPYDERSLSNVLKHALAKTTIKKPVSLHWLRHSYATHLLESGTDLRHIQEILGHNSSRTTELYTHVSTRSIQKIQSPFDSL